MSRLTKLTKDDVAPDLRDEITGALAG